MVYSQYIVCPAVIGTQLTNGAIRVCASGAAYHDVVALYIKALTLNATAS
jgi:hypothetical protein